MGWDFCSEWNTVSKARAAFLAEVGGKVLASKATDRGRTCWAVVETPKGERFIAVGIFEYEKVETSNGTKRTEWGYKAMSESMGPCYYDCPVEYLDMVPETNAEWRTTVREVAGRATKSYSAGDPVRIYGKDYVIVAASTKKGGGYDVRMVVNGVTLAKLYRAKPGIIEAR